MGYYTRYELTTDQPNAKVKCPTCGHCTQKSQREAIAALVGYDPFYDNTKWYSWSKDMIKHSLLHPEVLFTIDGEGEESGDVWRAYIKNGKMQQEKAKIQLAGFDESKLKEL